MTDNNSFYSHAEIFRLKPLSITILLAMTSITANAQVTKAGDESNNVVSFDSNMLMGAGARAIDVNRYSQGNPVDAGTYNIDVSINGKAAGRYDITFISGAVPGQARPDLTLEQLVQLGVDTDKLQVDVAPHDLFNLIPGATYSYSSSDLRLELSIPQASLLNRPRGYVSPLRWDRGVNAAFVDYAVNTYHSNNQGIDNSATYGNLNAGINLGIWRLRQRSMMNWGNETKNYEAIASYAQRDIDPLSSQLTLGDTFTDGELFDSVATRGVQLATDDRMLPDSQRGYAPVIRGIASTNARVTVRQNGFIIQEITVAPGAFEISDLNPTSNSGDLDVVVTEADGQEKHFTVPLSSVSRSLREGTSRYTTTIGQIRDLPYGESPYFAQATYQRGVSNLITGYTGVSASEGYGAAIFGGVLNSEYGALGADITTAKTDLAGNTFMGQSTRLTYNKVLQFTGTNFTVAAYRYSSAGYFGIAEALDARDQLRQFGYSAESMGDIRHARNKGQLNVSQNIGTSSYLYLNVSRQDYWNHSEHDTQYQAGYTHTLEWGSAGISASRTQDMYGKSATQYMVNFSVPLGSPSTKNRPYLSGGISTSSGGTSSLQSTLSGTAGEDRALSYGVTASSNNGGDSDGSNTTAGNIQYRTSAGNITSSLSKGSGFEQVSLGGAGSVVIHPAGITFGQPLGDTVAIIDAPEAAGATLTNATGVKLDRRGQAVVPYLNPYHINTMRLDPKGLSDDVELQNTSLEVVPRSGSVIIARFNTTLGRGLLINAYQANGTPLPFGSDVYDEDDRSVGVVGQGGVIFARVTADQGTLHINASGKHARLCSITYHLSPKGEATTDMERTDLPCQG